MNKGLAPGIRSQPLGLALSWWKRLAAVWGILFAPILLILFLLMLVQSLSSAAASIIRIQRLSRSKTSPSIPYRSAYRSIAVHGIGPIAMPTPRHVSSARYAAHTHSSDSCSLGRLSQNCVGAPRSMRARIAGSLSLRAFRLSHRTASARTFPFPEPPGGRRSLAWTPPHARPPAATRTRRAGPSPSRPSAGSDSPRRP